MKNKLAEIDQLKSQLVNIMKATKIIVDEYNKNYHQISKNEINIKLNSLEKEIGQIESRKYSISKEIENIKRKDNIKFASMNIANEINDSIA